MIISIIKKKTKIVKRILVIFLQKVKNMSKKVVLIKKYHNIQPSEVKQKECFTRSTLFVLPI